MSGTTTRISIPSVALGEASVCISRSRNVRGESCGKIEFEVQGHGIGSISLDLGQAREVAAALMAFVRAAEGNA